MARKNIVETSEVRAFAEQMSPLSRRKYDRALTENEIAASVAETNARIDSRLSEDPSFRAECEEMAARYAALELLESLMGTAAGRERLSSYRKHYHRDFDVSISFGANDAEPLSCSSREFAYA